MVSDVDKINKSVRALHRCFVVEGMGLKPCGFLAALMGSMATGAERVHLPEEGITLERLSDVSPRRWAGFAHGKRLGLVIRGEVPTSSTQPASSSRCSTTRATVCSTVRGAILGPCQDGGQPSPFDRIQATRLTAAAVIHLIAQAGSDDPASAIVGMREGRIEFTPLQVVSDLVDGSIRRPWVSGWWMALRPLADILAAVER